jgi:uncharacterized protein HemX
MNHRLLLCLLICLALIYFAVPKINVLAPGKEGTFAALWLVLAILAVGGNVTGMIYGTKKQKRKLQKRMAVEQQKRQLRQYH